MAIRNILRRSAGARRTDTRIEPAEDIVIELVLGSHRLGLLMRNPCESRIQGYPPLPVL